MSPYGMLQVAARLGLRGADDALAKYRKQERPAILAHKKRVAEVRAAIADPSGVLMLSIAGNDLYADAAREVHNG